MYYDRVYNVLLEKCLLVWLQTLRSIFKFHKILLNGDYVLCAPGG